MLQGWVIILTAFAYLGGLFGIAYLGRPARRRGAQRDRPPLGLRALPGGLLHPWTFYGSVGRAASRRGRFLTDLSRSDADGAALPGWCCARSIRISKVNRITSIADFISSRYGKSALLGGLVTIIAMVGVVPYIALQLKAVSTSITVLLDYPEVATRAPARRGPARPRHRVLCRAGARRLHHRLRHAPPRRHRAPRGHGRRHRLRVARQAARLPGGRGIRHLRAVRRLRRPRRRSRRPPRPAAAPDDRRRRCLGQLDSR